LSEKEISPLSTTAVAVVEFHSILLNSFFTFLLCVCSKEKPDPIQQRSACFTVNEKESESDAESFFNSALRSILFSVSAFEEESVTSYV
jgi:hypothetical protein